MIQLIAACIGGILTLAGMFFSAKASQRVDEKRLQRERCEALYKQFSRWSLSVSIAHLMLPEVMRGNLSFNDYWSNAAKPDPRMDEVDHIQIEMLVFAYFPELINAFKENKRLLTEHNAVITSFRQTYDARGDGTQFIVPFINAAQAFEQQSEKFKEEIIVLLRKHTS